MVMTSPPNARTSSPYSRSGSTMIMSWSVESASAETSCLAAIDLPEPDTPVIKPLPFKRFPRLQMMRLCDTALTP